MDIDAHNVTPLNPSVAAAPTRRPEQAEETAKIDECVEANALVMYTHGAYPGVGRMTRTPEAFRKWVDEPPLRG